MQPNWLPGGKKSHLGGLTQKVENNQGTIATMCLHKIWTKKQSRAELFLIHPKSAAFIWFSSCCQNYCCLYHFSAFTFSSWTNVTFAFSTPFILSSRCGQINTRELKKSKIDREASLLSQNTLILIFRLNFTCCQNFGIALCAVPALPQLFWCHICQSPV